MGWEVGQWVGTGFGIILGGEVGTRTDLVGRHPSQPRTCRILKAASRMLLAMEATAMRNQL